MTGPPDWVAKLKSEGRRRRQAAKATYAVTTKNKDNETPACAMTLKISRLARSTPNRIPPDQLGATGLLQTCRYKEDHAE